MIKRGVVVLVAVLAAVLLAMLLAVGCGGMKKVERKERKETSGSSSEKISRVESGERVVVRDTVVMVRAPVENSSNTGSDSSRLQTSLAWSVAVWKEGRLRHTIGNFPRVAAPLRVVYRDRWRESRDTLVVRDTFREISVEYRETKRVSGWDRMWALAGKLMLVIIAGWIAWRKLRPK